jgi:hypothetical protein
MYATKLGRVGGDEIPAQCREIQISVGSRGGISSIVLSPLAAPLKRPRSAKDVGQGHDYLMVLDVSDDYFVVL